MITFFEEGLATNQEPFFFKGQHKNEAPLIRKLIVTHNIVLTNVTR